MDARESMMRRRATVVLIVAAVLVIALWLMKTRRHNAESGAQKAIASAAPATSLAERSTRPVPQRVPVQLLPRADAAAEDQTIGTGFEGRVVSAPTGKGLDGAHLTFEHGGRTWPVSARADGAFSFHTEDVGAWLLAAATAPGHLPFAPEWGQSPVSFQIRKGEMVRGVTIALSPADEFDGMVVDPANNPVAGASITVLGGGAGASSLVALKDQYRSDAHGAFRFIAPPDAIVEAAHEGFARGRSRIDYSVRLSRKLTIRLKPLAAAQLTIDGTVLDHEGSPAEGAVVSAALKGKPGEPSATARVSVEGRFQLLDLDAGIWKLSASRAGSAPAIAEFAAGSKGVLLRLPRGGVLAGRVKEKRTGAPIAPFTVVVHGKEMRSVSVVDPSGEYRLHDLSPGPTAVNVVAPGYAPSSEVRVIVPEAGAGVARADFELTAGGRLDGVVVKQKTGAPIAGARVEVEGTPPSFGIPIRNETTTDADGRFLLTGLAENTVGIQVSATGHHARIVQVPPIPDGEQRGPLRIDLSPIKPGEQESVEMTGIGAQLERSGDLFVVTKVNPQGGAAEVGIAEGDAVTFIDGRPSKTMNFGDVVSLIRGPEGTTVTLVVQKGGSAQDSVTFVVPRRVVRG
jgi:hypothetical protein